MAKNKRPDAYSDVQADIGDRIRWAREVVGTSQTDVAKALGMQPSSLNRIELGKRPPNIFNVIALANRLGLSTDYILRGTLTGKENHELALRLVAEHPELILGKGDQDRDRDTIRVSSKAETSLVR